MIDGRIKLTYIQFKAVFRATGIAKHFYYRLVGRMYTLTLDATVGIRSKAFGEYAFQPDHDGMLCDPVRPIGQGADIPRLWVTKFKVIVSRCPVGFISKHVVQRQDVAPAAPVVFDYARLVSFAFARSSVRFHQVSNAANTAI